MGGGIAFERSTLDPRDQPQFSYGYNVPGAFAQDDIEVSRWLTLSASGRVDVHNEFGTFLRASAPQSASRARDSLNITVPTTSASSRWGKPSSPRSTSS